MNYHYRFVFKMFYLKIKVKFMNNVNYANNVFLLTNVIVDFAMLHFIMLVSVPFILVFVLQYLCSEVNMNHIVMNVIQH